MGQTPTYALPYPELADPADANKGFKDLANAVEAALTAQAIVPLGAILDWPYASGNIPTWALLPYGQLVGRVAYAGLHTLASAAGYPHGAGNGTTTFGLPDLRGRILAGKDDMGGTAANRITAAISGTAGTVLGAAIGSEGVTITAAQLPAHNHPATSDAQGAHTPTGSTDAQGSHSHGGGTAGRNVGHTHTSDLRTGSGTYGLVASGGGFQGNVLLRPGTVGGNAFGYLTDGESVDHSHAIGADGSHGHNITMNAVGNHTHTITVNNNTGGGGQHANVQPLLVVNKLMRAL